MPFILSPEQSVAASKLLDEQTSRIKYFDPITAMQVVVKSSFTALQNNKKVLIHIPDNHKDSAHFYRLWEATKMDQFSVNLDSTAPISEATIAELRSIERKSVDISVLVNARIAKITAEQTEEICLKRYNNLVSRTVNNRSVQEILDYSLSQRNIQSNNLNSERINLNIEFDPEDFYSTKKKISDLFERYEPQFDVLDGIELYSQLFYQTEDAEVNTLLSSIKAEMATLISNFEQCRKETQNRIYDEMAQKLNHARKEIKQIEDRLFEFSLHQKYNLDKEKSSFSFFSRKKDKKENTLQELYEKLIDCIHKASSSWYERLNSLNEESLSVELLTTKISEAKDELEHQFKEAKEKSIEMTLRINKINSDQTELSVLDEKMTALMDRLNSTGFFAVQFGNTILSAKKQEEYCISVHTHLDNAVQFASTYPEYRSWKRDLYNEVLSIDLRNALQRFPHNQWLTLFQTWYVQNLYNLTVKDDVSSSPEVYLKSRNEENEILISELANERVNIQKEAIDYLKKSNKELYTTLFKKKQIPNTSWYDLALMNRDFITTFYPVTISNKMSYAKDYDLVISFSEDHVEHNQYNCVTPITAEDVDAGPSEDLTFLYLNDFSDVQSLSSYNSIDKLRSAKKLTKFLLSLNQNVKLYQTKEANIISVLPPQNDILFKEAISDLGIKEIDTENTLYDRITESLLITDRIPHLVVKNGLINSQLVDTILWQAKVMDIMKKAGFQILDLDIEDIMLNHDQAYTNLKNLLPYGKKETIETEERINEEVTIHD